MHPDLIGLYYTLTTTNSNDGLTRAALADFFEENDLSPVSLAVRWMMKTGSFARPYNSNPRRSRLPTIIWNHAWHSVDCYPLYPEVGPYHFFTAMECDFHHKDPWVDNSIKIYGSLWRADLAFFQTYLSLCEKAGKHGVNKENVSGFRGRLRELGGRETYTENSPDQDMVWVHPVAPGRAIPSEGH